MVVDDALPFDLRDPLFIEMRPVFLPAFLTRTAPGLRYDRLERHGIREIEVTPVYYEGRFGSSLLFRHEILFFFDPDEFPVEDYGLIHGDETFARAASDHIARLLPSGVFGRIGYTMAREQGDDFVSMSFPFDVSDSRLAANIFRKTPAIARALGFSEQVAMIRTITNADADRYWRAVSPATPEEERPDPPADLPAGLWIHRSGSS